jgi:hypothetical protein
MAKEHPSGGMFDVPCGCQQNDWFAVGNREDVIHAISGWWLLELPLVAMLELDETIGFMAIPLAEFGRRADVFEPLVETCIPLRHPTRP